MIWLTSFVVIFKFHSKPSVNAEREKLGLHVMPIDEFLLAALPQMTACAGIALGVDRLLMIATEQMQLEKVITFPASIS